APDALFTAPAAVAAAPAGGAAMQVMTTSCAPDSAAALAALWSDTFATAAPAPCADLFEAGATSFDVVRFVDAAGRAGLALTVADVFASPTLAALGARIDASAETEQEVRDAG
ncbi:phosphopantetheine-binding protein, partial [Burkholderia diffusa]